MWCPSRAPKNGPKTESGTMLKRCETYEASVSRRHFRLVQNGRVRFVVRRPLKYANRSMQYQVGFCVLLAEIRLL